MSEHASGCLDHGSARNLAAVNRVVLCVLSGLIHSSGLNAQSCERPVASFDVQFIAPDRFVVAAEFAQPTRRLDLNFFRASGRPEGQAESILGLLGWGSDGREVAIDYVGRAGWTVSGDRGLVRIRYTVRADHGNTTWGDGGPDEVAARFDDVFFFVGHAFFLIDHGWPPCPVHVSFRTPESWTVMAPWRQDATTFVASEPMTLWNNAFAVGRFSPGRTVASGMELQWIIDSRLASIEEHIITLMDRLPGVFVDYFGSAPAEAYSVVVFGDAFTDGGAFRQSFALRPPSRRSGPTYWAMRFSTSGLATTSAVNDHPVWRGSRRASPIT